MNRRSFLKLSGTATAALALPVPALGALWPKSAPLPTKESLEQLQLSKEAIITAQGTNWWALSDLTIHGSGMYKVMVGDQLLQAMTVNGVHRMMLPPNTDLLFPANQLLRIEPAPKAFCAIVRGPENQWYITADNTLGRYVPVKGNK